MNDAKPSETPGGIRFLAGRLGEVLDGALHRVDPGPKLQDVGTITRVGRGVALAEGLPGVQSEELVLLPGGQLAMAYNLDEDEVGLILFEGGENLSAGAEVYPTGTILSVPVGEALQGRVVDPLGRPLDNRGPIPMGQRRPIERKAPAIMDRAPVTVPLQTGIKAVDALIPIGRGQRELIVGDRQTGKTAIALDTIINQRGRDVICVYCVIGKESAAVARIVADLDSHDARSTCIIVSATGADPPGLQFAAPYAAMTMGEYFMHRGQDVLVVFDDLTRHARAYREMSLLLRRPPGREAFPGDIFYIHSRLLERSTHLQEELGGGTLTTLPIVETEDQNIAAYIPTNLISITDGQIYLSPDLFQKGVLPAIDVGKSVSRVGGKTQLPAYRAVAGDLRLSYSQFEELEAFARFGTRLDESTRRTLERGRRVREILKQPQYGPLSVPEQIAVLNAVTAGLLDDLPTERIGAAEEAIRKAAVEDLPELNERMLAGAKLEARDEKALVGAARRAIEKTRG